VPVPGDNVVLHVIEQQAYTFAGTKGEIVATRPLTEDEAEVVAYHRELLLMGLAEHDEALEEIVLMEEEADDELVWKVLAKCTQAGLVRPAFGGSALRNWGIQPLLDAVLKMMPSPLDRPASKGIGPDGEPELVEMTSDGSLVALVFKVQLLDGRRHCFARVYRGVLTPGQEVRIAGRDRTERVARVFDIDANRKTRAKNAEAGTIVLLAGLRHATTGDTLCDVEHEVFLERIDAREPVLGLAVEPESSKDEDKMFDVLGKMAEEDPTLRFEEDPDTGQRILKGMGELHLQISFERIEREFNLKLRVGKPRVMHRECIAKAASASGGVDRVIEGAQTIELKAAVSLSVEPLERGGGIEVECEPTWSPAGFEPSDEQREAVASGARDGLSGGPLEGAPLEDVKVIVHTVTTFETGSSPQALRIAAATAVRDALVAAGGLLMQPIMKIEVVVPDENTGSVLGDLQSKSAQISNTESEAGMTTISAECGLSNLIGYTTELRSITRGRGQFVMEFDRFDAL
jgi:elongation factor G